MSWTRLRTWIGLHPVRCQVAGAVACTMPTWLVPITGFDPAMLSPSPMAAKLIGTVVVLVVALGSLLWTCLIGCLVARSGRPVQPLLWKSLPWVLLATTAVAAVPLGIVARQKGNAEHLVYAPMAGLGAALMSGFQMMIGLALAQSIAYSRMADGRWDVSDPTPDLRRPRPAADEELEP